MPTTILTSPTNPEASARINNLIDRIETEIKTEKNQVRGNVEPQAIFGMEEPIASARLYGYDVNDFFSDPHFHIEQSLRQRLWRWDHFPEDDLPLTLDFPVALGYYPEYTFLGMSVEFTPGGIPTIQSDHPLTQDPDLTLLQPVDFYSSGWMPRILRWWDEINRISAGRLNLTYGMIWWRGCLDLAIQLRGFQNFIMDTLERPQFVHDLLSFLTEQRCRWYDAYYHHFGLPVQAAAVADDWINIPLVSPSVFRDFVLPQYLKIEQYHGKISGLHSCGDMTPVLQYILELKSLDVLEISPWTNLDRSLQIIPPEKRLQIGIRPNDVLFASAGEVEAQISHITAACKDRSYNIGTSGLTPILDSEQAFIDKVNTWIEIAKCVLKPYRHPSQSIAAPKESQFHVA